MTNTTNTNNPGFMPTSSYCRMISAGLATGLECRDKKLEEDIITERENNNNKRHCGVCTSPALKVVYTKR